MSPDLFLRDVDLAAWKQAVRRSDAKRRLEDANRPEKLFLIDDNDTASRTSSGRKRVSFAEDSWDSESSSPTERREGAALRRAASKWPTTSKARRPSPASMTDPKIDLEGWERKARRCCVALDLGIL